MTQRQTVNIESTKGSDTDDDYLFFEDGLFNISSVKGKFCYWMILCSLLILISPIIGIITFNEQFNVWKEYSSGYLDDEQINIQCNDKYSEFSKVTRNRDGSVYGDGTQGTDPGIYLNKLIILYSVDLGYIVFMIIFYFVMRICVINKKFEGLDAAYFAGGPGGAIIIWIVEAAMTIYYIINYLSGIEQYCNKQSDIYQSLVANNNKNIVLFQCIMAFVKIVLLCINGCATACIFNFV